MKKIIKRDNDSLKKEYINRYAEMLFRITGIKVSDDFKNKHFECSSIKEYKNRDFFAKKGSMKKESYFMVKGAAIGFLGFENDKIIVKLFLDEDNVTTDNIVTDLPSEKTIQFAENSTGLLNDTSNPIYVELLEKLLELGITKKLYEHEIAHRSKIIEVKSMNGAKQRINGFNKHFPAYFNRYNSTILASFLGMTRERFTVLRKEVYKDV